ncbi:MAG: diguanylate cyclase [Epsilonproteobacteria bacterium]|nr:diguanylate cyclase [Campylobacterota bacterium]
MKIKNYVDPVHSKEYTEIAEKTLEDVIAYFQTKNNPRLYILQDEKPLYIFTPVEIVDIFLQNKKDMKVKDYIQQNKKEIYTLSADMHIIDAYNDLRRRKLDFAPVMEDFKLIGEVSFETLSLKISFIAIKDPLTDVYNQKYFEVMIEESNELDKPLGIIMIRLENLSILESLYGHNFKLKVLKTFAKEIQNSIRDIDFVFRVENTFKILTFNNLEIVVKMVNRIKDRLSKIEIDELQIPFKMAFSHVPEIEMSVLLAVEECERKLIERD